VTISGDGRGGPCLPPRFQPELHAGVKDAAAGKHSPFSFQLVRPDGDQLLSTVKAVLPPGLLASVKNLSVCSTAAAAAGTCDDGSLVGHLTVGVGPGAHPFYVKGGRAYLTQGYKGAPFGLSLVVPAIAGPFDLGDVVVRAALHINPITTQVSVDPDPFPTILQGIPLQLRDIRLNMDRPGFMINPTDCTPTTITATAVSVSGTQAPLSNPFQAFGCGELGFKPKLALKLFGATHRSAHPALRAVLKTRDGDANIGRAVVTLPKTEFLENAHIRTVCTRVQYAADNCPKGSIYGYAKAWSPLLDKPLEGPVYLRSSDNPLPDLVASLDGQIHIDLDGRIDSVHSRMRATFDSVPDAPVTKFVLNMQGGKKGLLVNNTELCQAKPRASARFTGYNGKRSSSKPLVKADCGKK
jgi:hypothetical protein